jgi:hypothetical protein
MKEALILDQFPTGAGLIIILCYALKCGARTLIWIMFSLSVFGLVFALLLSRLSIFIWFSRIFISCSVQS